MILQSEPLCAISIEAERAISSQAGNQAAMPPPSPRPTMRSFRGSLREGAAAGGAAGGEFVKKSVTKLQPLQTRAPSVTALPCHLPPGGRRFPLRRAPRATSPEVRGTLRRVVGRGLAPAETDHLPNAVICRPMR